MFERIAFRISTTVQRTLRLTAVLAVPALFTVIPPSAMAGDLRIDVSGVNSDQGAVRVAIYRAGSAFLEKGQIFAAMSQQASPGDLMVVFGDLPADRYAVAIYHDANSNDELDSNLLGIPLEGTAFSEGAVANFGPPSFEDAAVSVPAEGQVTTLATMSY